MAVMAFHAGIALREAVTVIRVAGDVAEQLVHGFIKVFVALIGHLQLILAVRSPRDVEFFEVKALDVFYRALFTAHELAVVLDAQGQQDGGDLRRIGFGACRRWRV